MTEAGLSARQDQGPDYEYGNRSPIEVVRLKPVIRDGSIDPHASLELDNSAGIVEKPPFTEQELEHKVAEIADNYQVVGDPKATEKSPRQFGVTIANKDMLEGDNDVLLVMSTQGSSIYDKGKPNNEGNVLELAYTALKYPDTAVVFVESPGTGNSTDFTDEEYKQASQNGKLIHDVKDNEGKIIDSETFETFQALVRALEQNNIDITLISANASGAHCASGLAAGLPEGLRGIFLYNSTNISDRSPIALSFATGIEILKQGKYGEVSRDPLKLTDERKEMTRLIMGLVKKGKITQARSKTHNPRKLWRQQKIFSRGNGQGQAAAVHAVAGQLKHPLARTTHVFPEFAAQYKSPEDFKQFVRLINQLGGRAVSISDVESLKIPLGQYGHSNYPSVRQTLEGYAFNR